MNNNSCNESLISNESTQQSACPKTDNVLRAEALYECIRCGSVAWAFDQALEQLDASVENLSDPKDVVNTLRVFLDLNYERFKSAERKSQNALDKLMK